MAKGLYLGDPTTGLAKRVKKMCLGDPLTGVARNIKKVYIGDPSIGVARLCYTAGERGVFIAGFEGSQTIIRTTNIEDQSSYMVIPLSNVMYGTVQEFGDYYVMLWKTSSSRGLYYSTDGKEWQSTDMTSFTSSLYNEPPLVYNGELYIKDWSSSKLMYHMTNNCTTFTTIEATALPWYGYGTKHLGGTKWAKLTYDTNNNVDSYKVSISNDGGTSWVTGGTVVSVKHNGSSSWSSGAELLYVDGLLFVCGSFIEYQSTNYMDYVCDLVQVDLTTGKFVTRIYAESNTNTPIAYDFTQPISGNLAFRYGIRRESESARFLYVRKLIKINPNANDTSRKYEEIGNFDTPYYPTQNENGLVTLDCPDRNCHYILMTKSRYIGAGLRNYTLAKVNKAYSVAADCVTIINNDTPSVFGIASLVYKKI
jgi:hypothetical protein|uniref:Uncharacterized protein n=1 Tax=Caudovirales sp. ctCiv1 TaxID=2826769 RepID=A0A8S5M8Z0_9CAUD|nr:hypothetical protein [uncultured Lachnoclostridium sp.]DAD78551.1 MAG TPA: hypothetical protein [Caudovirales sp. ctCiv1]